MWVYGEGSANGKHEDEDDVERTRKIYYGLPHLGGEDATAVRYSGNLSLQIFITATTIVLSLAIQLFIRFILLPFSLTSLFLSLFLILRSSSRVGAMRWRIQYIGSLRGYSFTHTMLL